MDFIDACNTIRQRAPHIQPRIAVVLGSGWGGLTEHLSDAVQIAYTELPGFPQPGVAGHSGTLWLGRLGAMPVAVMSGRQHGYETGAVDGMNGVAHIASAARTASAHCQGFGRSAPK